MYIVRLATTRHDSMHQRFATLAEALDAIAGEAGVGTNGDLWCDGRQLACWIKV